MKSNSPRKNQKSSKSPAPAAEITAARWLIPIAIVLSTWAAFLPTLSNDFVEWDDYETVLSNPYFRGLGWSNLAWMFTTFHMGHYQPLSWLTLALDYSIWGIHPVGYHLTNILLHSANALACYFVSRRLLSLALPEATRRDSLSLLFSAGFAALFFALHPLRVESVAWVTERRDVLSGLFYLWTIHAYLRANADANSRSQRWRVAAIILYGLSLLSKATAITLPIVLLLLDGYPLRRLSWSARQWFSSEERKVWREKIPFAALGLTFAAIAIFSQQHASALKSFDSHGLGSRLAQVFFSAGFYLGKTLLPAGLSPLYEIPPNYGAWDWASLIAGAVVLLVSLALFLIKDRWPPALACWLYYLTVLAPVSGPAQSGPQLVADRYSYLSCLSWAVLAGGLLLFLFQRAERLSRGVPVNAMIGAGALTAVTGLGYLTWQQCAVWRNTETLWSRVLSIDPNSSYAHYNLARSIARKTRYQEAIHHYREALRIRPDDVDARNNLGLLLAITGQVEASLSELHRTTEIDPTYAKGYFNLGRVLARRGDIDLAAKNFVKALELHPKEAAIHLALGNVLVRQGRLAEAGERFEAAVRLRPDFADAHVAMARWLIEQGKKDRAAEHYREALRLMESRTQMKARVEGSRNTEEYPPGDSARDPSAK